MHCTTCASLLSSMFVFNGQISTVGCTAYVGSGTLGFGYSGLSQAQTGTSCLHCCLSFVMNIVTELTRLTINGARRFAVCVAVAELLACV